MAISACTSNLNLKGGLSTSITTAPPNTGTGADNASSLNLSNVTLDTTSGIAQDLNLIGDGTGSMGNLCQQQAAPGASPACACTFYYNSTGAGTTSSTSSSSSSSTITYSLQVDVPVSYVESDLIRCPYASLPSTVTSFNVAVHILAPDTFSNQVNFNLAASTNIFDPTNPLNFTLIQRFQCRDIVQVPFMLDSTSGIYDPIQSENPHLSYPTDYYTPSLGISIQAYVTAFSNLPSLNLWNCPAVLNPNLYLTGNANDPTSPLYNYINNNQINMTVYSVAPLSSNSIIYPPSPGTSDRSTFYLANQQGGAFTVPVNGLIAPGINTVYPGTSQYTSYASNPLGFGAAPIPIGTGTGNETCPDSSVAIPPNYHWMKLWLFRGQLAARNQQISNAMVKNVATIMCNPGDWPATSPGGSIYMTPSQAGCYLQKSNDTAANLVNASDVTNDYYSIALSDVGTSGNGDGATIYLADRALGSNQCVRLQNVGSSKTCGASGANFLPGPGCNGGYDVWEMELPFLRDSNKTTSSNYFNDQTGGCGQFDPGSPSTTSSTIVSDPFNLCTATITGTNANSDNTGLAPGPTNKNASTPVITTFGDVTQIPLDKGGSRFDFLFVVSPPSVTTADMTVAAANGGLNIGSPYQPMRFQLASDCTSSDPYSCPSTNLITYNITLHDLGSNDDPSSAIVYPVCVLQPN